MWNYEAHRLVDRELEVIFENLISFKDGSSGQEAQIPQLAAVQIFDISQSSVISSRWHYRCYLVDNTSVVYLRILIVLSPLIVLQPFLEFTKNWRWWSSFSLTLDQISSKVSGVFILSASPKARDRQLSLCQLVLSLEMNTSSVTSGSTLLCWLCRGPITLCPCDCLCPVNHKLSLWAWSWRRVPAFFFHSKCSVHELDICSLFILGVSWLTRQALKPHWAQLQYG